MNADNNEGAVIGKRLRAARTAARMTQDDVAAEVGRTRQAVSLWEVGSTSPTVPELRRLCALYGVSADLVLFGEVPRVADVLATAFRGKRPADHAEV